MQGELSNLQAGLSKPACTTGQSYGLCNFVLLFMLQVGPLPLDPKKAMVEPLRRPGEIPFHKHPLNEEWVGNAASTVSFASNTPI